MIVCIMQSSYWSRVKVQFTDATEEDCEVHCNIKEGQYKITYGNFKILMVTLCKFPQSPILEQFSILLL